MDDLDVFVVASVAPLSFFAGDSIGSVFTMVLDLPIGLLSFLLFFLDFFAFDFLDFLDFFLSFLSFFFFDLSRFLRLRATDESSDELELDLDFRSLSDESVQRDADELDDELEEDEELEVERFRFFAFFDDFEDFPFSGSMDDFSDLEELCELF